MPLSERQKAAIDHVPVCLFSRRGELIWRSTAWTRPGPRRDDQVLGTKWHEFIFPDDLPGLLAWLAGDDMQDFTFMAQLPKTGVVASVTYRKTPYRCHWLCVGVVEVRPPPGSNPI